LGVNIPHAPCTCDVCLKFVVWSAHAGSLECARNTRCTRKPSEHSVGTRTHMYDRTSSFLSARMLARTSHAQHHRHQGRGELLSHRAHASHAQHHRYQVGGELFSRTLARTSHAQHHRYQVGGEHPGSKGLNTMIEASRDPGMTEVVKNHVDLMTQFGWDE
jgi:hypothetical protein